MVIRLKLDIYNSSLRPGNSQNFKCLCSTPLQKDIFELIEPLKDIRHQLQRVFCILIVATEDCEFYQATDCLQSYPERLDYNRSRSTQGDNQDYQQHTNELAKLFFLRLSDFCEDLLGSIQAIIESQLPPYLIEPGQTLVALEKSGWRIYKMFSDSKIYHMQDIRLQQGTWIYMW